MYPNFYIFLVGPPRIVAKTTAVNFGEKILMHYADFIEDPVLKIKKQTNLLRSKATPESLTVALQPKKENILVGEKFQTINLGSQLSLAIGELSTFLGKQKYNAGLIDRLTHLYDCKDEDDELTIGRGHNKFYNVYVTLIGATTPQHLEESIPEEAFGGGFMSRVVVVYQDIATREYPFPQEVTGGPKVEDLQKALAWIAENAQGEFVLSPEAAAHYEAWYRRFKAYLTKNIEDSKIKMQYRHDVHMLKLAMLIRAQRYEPGNVVELSDLKQAERMMKATYEDSHESIRNVGVTGYTSSLNRVLANIKKYKKRTRRQLLLNIDGVSADMLTKILEELMQRRQITGRIEGKVIKKPSTRSNEIYFYEGGTKNV
jgi:hypothetical protein